MPCPLNDNFLNLETFFAQAISTILSCISIYYLIIAMYGVLTFKMSVARYAGAGFWICWSGGYWSTQEGREVVRDWAVRYKAASTTRAILGVMHYGIQWCLGARIVGCDVIQPAHFMIVGRLRGLLGLQVSTFGNNKCECVTQRFVKIVILHIAPWNFC